MPMPSVSVILPLYNGEDFVIPALNSIRAQTRLPNEVVVVDDGSLDESLKCVEEYAAQSSLRIVVRSQANHGCAAARNEGIRSSSGEIIAFLDADDLWLPEKLQLQMEIFRSDPTLDMCFARLRNFLDGVERPWWAPEDSLSQPWDAEQLSTCITQRAIFEQHGLFDESLPVGSDMEWFLRTKRAGCSRHILEEVLVLRRIHQENLSHQKTSSGIDRTALEILFRASKRTVNPK